MFGLLTFNRIVNYVTLLNLLVVQCCWSFSSSSTRITIWSKNICNIERYREKFALCSASDIRKISTEEKTKSLSLLGLTALLWGSYGMGMKYLFTAASPPELLFNLFAAAASAASLVLSSAYFHQRGTLSVPTEKILDKRRFSPERLAGLELGAYLSIASVFQIYGLGLTTVGHSAFIIQLATVFAPLLQAAMYRLVPSFASIASTVVAFCGVLLLTTSSGSAATASTIRAGVLGDILSLIAALIYGLHVVRLGVFAPRFSPMVLANMKEQSRLFISLASFLVAAFLPLVVNQPSPVLNATYSFLHGTPSSGWLAFLAVVLWQGENCFYVVHKDIPSHRWYLLTTTRIVCDRSAYAAAVHRTVQRACEHGRDHLRYHAVVVCCARVSLFGRGNELEGFSFSLLVICVYLF